MSCARTIRTFAPWLIRVSTSVSCCSLLRFASGVDVRAAAVLDGLLHGRLVVAAQRGCWKLFHETPTMQSPAASLAAGWLAAQLALCRGLGRRRRCRAAAAARGDDDGRGASQRGRSSNVHPVLLLLQGHGAAHIVAGRAVAVAYSNAVPGDAWLTPLCLRAVACGRVRWSTSRAPFRRSPAEAEASRGPEVARRIGQERLEGELGRAEQRGVLAEGGRHDPDEARGAGSARRVELAPRRSRPDGRQDPAEQAAEHDELAG